MFLFHVYLVLVVRDWLEGIVCRYICRYIGRYLGIYLGIYLVRYLGRYRVSRYLEGGLDPVPALTLVSKYYDISRFTNT